MFVTAEELHGEAVISGISVSLATVYNTLHQFTEAGLLRETVVEPGRSYFDTNTADHHHFFCEATGKLHDIPAEQLSVSGLPLPPAGSGDQAGRDHRPDPPGRCRSLVIIPILDAACRRPISRASAGVCRREVPTGCCSDRPIPGAGWGANPKPQNTMGEKHGK
jgi:Ferric uptake regulator family